MSELTNSKENHPQEKRNLSRQQVGMFLGPLAALMVYVVFGNVLPEVPRRTAAAASWMAVFWICETIPLAATALMPVILFPVLGILEIDSACAPFARPVIFLFLGGFLLAQAVEKCGLHRRLALLILYLVGKTPARLLAGLIGTSAFLSMWISNTATVVMLVPIVGSLASFLKSTMSSNQTAGELVELEKDLLLGVAFASSIGGMGTLVGTPPNALLVNALEEIGISIGFGQWMLFALPLVVVYLVFLWWFLYQFALPASLRNVATESSMTADELKKLGPMTRAEWTVAVVFVLTALAWILREPLQHWPWLVQQLPLVAQLNDSSIAMTAAVVLFLLPVEKSGSRALDWGSAVRLPWGVLILIGGGMSLAVAMNNSGLSQLIAEQLTWFQNLPPVLMVIAVAGIIIFLTELTSNTATTATMLPVLAGVGSQLDCGPLSLMVPAAMAASCAFMLPVATPPNAVVFDTGKIPMGTMVRYGFWLNLAGILLITILMATVGGWVLNCEVF